MKFLSLFISSVVLSVLVGDKLAAEALASPTPTKNRPTPSTPQVVSALSKAAASTFLAASLAFSPAFPAHANEPSVIGEIQGSGLVFKDSLRVEAFEDPKVQGVMLYISNFQRPLTERLSSAKNFFTDPSQAGVACAKIGPVKIADNINKSKQGEEVFQESKSILFKSLRVQRLYDEEHQSVVYVAFSTRLDKGDDDNKSRFKSSLCAVNLEELKPTATVAPSQ